MEIVANDGRERRALFPPPLPDLERVCDYLIILIASRVQLSDEVTELLGSHWRLMDLAATQTPCPRTRKSSRKRHTDKQSTFLVRTNQPILDPAWNVKPVTLEDLVLAYMSNPRRPERVRPPGLGAVR